MNYMRGFTNLKEHRQLHCDPTCQTDSKAGRYLSSRAAWDRARIGPGEIGMVFSGPDPTQLKLLSMLNEDRQISEFICNV